MTNSRMKDFLDLRLLLHDTMLGNTELQRAIELTIARRRQTAMPGALPTGLSDVFLADAARQMQRRAFIEKNKLDAMDLAEVVLYVGERVRLCGFASA